MNSEKECNETCCATKQCYIYVYEPLTKFCLLYLCTSKSGCDIDFQIEDNSYKFLSKNNTSMQVKLGNNPNPHEIKWNYVHNKTTETTNDTINETSTPPPKPQSWVKPSHELAPTTPKHQSWVKSSHEVSTTPAIKHLFDNYTDLLENLKKDFGKYNEETLSIGNKQPTITTATTTRPLKINTINTNNLEESFNLVTTTFSPHIINQDFTCEVDYIFDNVVIPESTIAMLVIQHPTDNVYNINECGSLCCNSETCDIGYLKGRRCFQLSCTNKKLCYFTTASKLPNNKFKQAVAYVKRRGVSLFENLLKNEPQTSIQSHEQVNNSDTPIKFYRKSENKICLYSYPIQAKLSIWNIPMSFFSIELSTNLEQCQDTCCKTQFCFAAYQNEGYCFLVICKMSNKHRCFKYTRPPYLQKDPAFNSLLVYVKKRKKSQNKTSNELNRINSHVEITTAVPQNDFYSSIKNENLPLQLQPQSPSQDQQKQTYYGNNYQYTPFTMGYPWRPFQNFYVSELGSKKSSFDMSNDLRKNNFNTSPQSYGNPYEQPPTIKSIQPSKIVLQQHLSVTFYCDTEGYPKPQISWSLLKGTNSIKHNNYYTDNLEAVKNDDRIRTLDAGYLIINNIHPKDSGIYVCTATNNYGSVYLEASLDVLDVNECNATSPGSNPPCKHTCVNTIGSYYCKCFNGYELSSVDNSTCMDIDECLNKLTNNCNQLCVNTEGSYFCQCLSGYKMTGENSCKDVDECSVMKNPCGNGICKNTIGSFSCECDSIYDYFSKETNQCVKNKTQALPDITSNDFTIFKRSLFSKNNLYVAGLVLSGLFMLFVLTTMIIMCIRRFKAINNRQSL